MARKVIVSCAVTGGAASPAKKHPGLPFSPEEIAVAVLGSIIKALRTAPGAAA